VNRSSLRVCCCSLASPRGPALPSLPYDALFVPALPDLGPLQRDLLATFVVERALDFALTDLDRRSSSSVIVMVATLLQRLRRAAASSRAAELAWQTAQTVGLWFVVVQSSPWASRWAYHWSSIQPALLLSVPYLGFSC